MAKNNFFIKKAKKCFYPKCAPGCPQHAYISNNYLKVLLGFQNGSDVKDVNIAFANLLTFLGTFLELYMVIYVASEAI